VSQEIAIALIAATPPTVAAILGFLANRRSLRRSVGTPPGIPLSRAIERVESKVDRLDAKIEGLGEGQAVVRERLARLESRGETGLWSPR